MEPEQNEIEDAAHKNFPHGHSHPIGSLGRSIYENKKESFIAGVEWVNKQNQDTWQTVNTSNTENTMGMQPTESKDLYKVMTNGKEPVRAVEEKKGTLKN